MVGIRSGVATVLQREVPRAILTHCYGHSLQLAVCDTVKQVKVTFTIIALSSAIANPQIQTQQHILDGLC